MNVYVAFGFAFLIVTAGCAKRPENIAATPFSTASFSSMNCSQLAQQELSASQNLENLSAQQRQAANGDAWGVFLLGLPVSSMSGSDQEAQISITRGQMQAIDQVQASRGC